MEVEMKMVRSLLLGTAAGFVAVAGAQAADMPVKAAVNYVKICNLYGDGFYYIPGTDICLKLGGYVRVELYYNYGQNATNTPFFTPNFYNAQLTGFNNDFAFRTRSLMTVDTRQQTDYGVLRTYFLIGHTGDMPTAEGLYANRGFIQFAGFTFGLAQSFFDFYSVPAVSYFANNAEDTGASGWRVAAFTANFGNGVTSTLSLEEPRRLSIIDASVAGQVTGGFTADSSTSGQGTFNNPFLVGAPNPMASNDYNNLKNPDLVYNWRIDQSWGALMLGGVLHDASGGYYGAAATSPQNGTTCAAPGFVVSGNVDSGVPGGSSLTGSASCGHPSNKLGWVATGGLRINAPGGSYLQVQGSYTEGAVRYISHNQLGAGSPAAFFGVGNSLGVGWGTDGIFGQGGEVELTRAWGIYASWEQVWNPAWKTSLYGGFIAINYDANAKALIAATTCGVGPGSGGTPQLGTTTPNSQASGSLSTMTNCDPNWQIGYVGSRTQWNVTPHFYMGFDINYTKLYTAFAGTAVYRAVAGTPRPAGVYSIQNQDNLALVVRFQRDIVP
jgi:porin-like protein